MCPLIAPDGSPWTGQYAAPCPGQDDTNNGGCPGWSITCAVGVVQGLVEESAEVGGRPPMPTFGPNKPRRFAVLCSKRTSHPLPFAAAIPDGQSRHLRPVERVSGAN
jgi:hypothetical protein